MNKPIRQYTTQELKEWDDLAYILMTDNGKLNKQDYRELIRLNSLIGDVYREIHNGHTMKHFENQIIKD